MPCTICQHPQRQAIDLALLHQTLTLAQLSRQYNLSQSALHRHKQHLLKKMALSQNRFQTSLREGCLVILYSFLERLIHITRTAAAEGNSRQVLQAVRQGVGIIKCMHKMDLNLDLDSLYRLLASPQWAEQGALLPTDLQFTAGSRQDLAAGLFSSCPEPASDQEQALEELADLHNLMSAFPASELPLPASGKKPGKKRKKIAPLMMITSNIKEIACVIKISPNFSGRNHHLPGNPSSPASRARLLLCSARPAGRPPGAAPPGLMTWMQAAWMLTSCTPSAPAAPLTRTSPTMPAPPAARGSKSAGKDRQNP